MLLANSWLRIRFFLAGSNMIFETNILLSYFTRRKMYYFQKKEIPLKIFFICHVARVLNVQHPVCNRLFAELGTRQHCRDNATTSSGQKTVDYVILSIFVLATPFRHPGLDTFRISSCLWSHIKLSRCRFRVVTLSRI